MPARQLNCSTSRRRFLGGMPDSTSKTTHQEMQRSARCYVAFCTSAITTERWLKARDLGDRPVGFMIASKPRGAAFPIPDIAEQSLPVSPRR